MTDEKQAAGPVERATTAILGPAPPAVTPEEQEQWDTLCSVTTYEGLCSEPAVDPAAPLRICAPHLGLAVALALKRLPMIEAANLVEGKQG